MYIDSCYTPAVQKKTSGPSRARPPPWQLRQGVSERGVTTQNELHLIGFLRSCLRENSYVALTSRPPPCLVGSCRSSTRTPPGLALGSGVSPTRCPPAGTPPGRHLHVPARSVHRRPRRTRRCPDL